MLAASVGWAEPKDMPGAFSTTAGARRPRPGVKRLLMSLLGGAALAGALAAGAAEGRLIIENPRDYEITLSGLVLYGEDARLRVLRALGEGGAAEDDEVLAPGARKSFPAAGRVRRWVVAERYLPGAENVTVVTRPRAAKPVEVPFAVAARLRDEVVLRVDTRAAPALAALSNEAQLAFRDGRHPDLPGVLAGTGLAPERGEVTGAYTGKVILLKGYRMTLRP